MIDVRQRLQLPSGASTTYAQSLGLDGSERFDFVLGGPVRPGQGATLRIAYRDRRRA